MDFDKLRRFALSEKLRDITLEFRNSAGEVHEIPAHKLILAAHSDLFFHLLQFYPNISKLTFPAFLDSQQKKTEFSEIEALLKFLYSNEEPAQLKNFGLTKENALNFFVGARVLGLPKVESYLAGFVEKEVFTTPNELDSWINAIKFGHSGWVESLKVTIAAGFSEILESQGKGHPVDSGSAADDEHANETEAENPKILEIPYAHFLELIRRNDITVPNEEFILDLVLKYIESSRDLPARDFDEQVLPNMKQRFYDLPKIFGHIYFEENLAGGSGEAPPEEVDLEKSEITTEENNKISESEVTHLDLAKMCKFKNKWNVIGEGRIRRFGLSGEQKRALLHQIRFPFLEHSTLVKLSTHEAFADFSDILLEGFSSKLNKYEECKLKYRINCKSRDNYKSTSKARRRESNLSREAPAQPGARSLGQRVHARKRQ